MQLADFNAAFETLTPRQRRVLQDFLLGKTDEAIAQALHLEPSTVRRHLANICKRFHLNEDLGRGSHRDELIGLIARFKPDLVDPALTGGRKPEFPGGPLPAGSPLYIQRSVEQRCHDAIQKPGGLVRIRAPRRTGKTSLLNQLLIEAGAVGLRTVSLNLGQAEASLLTGLDSTLRWISTVISHRLGIAPQLDSFWDEQFGSIVSCTLYMQEQVLSQCPQGLVLALDEVDRLFDVPQTAQGVFALLRSWHEEANNLAVWQRLRLIVVHATDVYIPLNLHQSPFNVGLPVRLPNFSEMQVLQLMQRYGFSKVVYEQSAALTHLTNGHPYLVQLALYHFGQSSLSPETLLRTAATQSGIYSDHLRHCWHLLQTHPDLQAALQAVISVEPRGTVLDPVCAYKLESMGLVTLEGNSAAMSCDLYRQYFGDRLL